MESPPGFFSRISRYQDVLLVLAGIFLFALYVHERSWLVIRSFAGLLLVALSLVIFLMNSDEGISVFGSLRFTPGGIGFLITGIVVGGILGLSYRHFFFDTTLPASITTFAIISPLIGITEELLFRGYLQGRIRGLNRVLAIVVAALGHTTYKCIVLRSLPDPSGIDFTFLITWTMIGGLIFGILRDLSDSIFPPALAHGCFDVIVYGGFVSAPVWVWG
jgi:membrane protease YdiL (CAAX protease family)